jgi:hypothetical protein
MKINIHIKRSKHRVISLLLGLLFTTLCLAAEKSILIANQKTRQGRDPQGYLWRARDLDEI